MSAPLKRAYDPSPPVAYAMLAATMLMWAIGVVVARGVHETVPPIGLSFWRWFAGAAVLVPFIWPDLVRTWPIVRARWKFFVVLGGVLLLSGTGLLVGVNYTTAINATLVNASQPAVTAIGAVLIGRERLNRWQWLGVLCAFAGIVVMASRGEWAVLASFGFNIGDIVVFVATFGFSAYALNISKLPREMGQFTAMTVVALGGSIVLLPLYLWESVAVRPMPLTGEMVFAVATLALFMTILSIYTWNAGNRAVGPSKAGVFVNLFPVFSAALAISFLGERLYAFHIAGAALVCLGITLVVMAGRKKPTAN